MLITLLLILIISNAVLHKRESSIQFSRTTIIGLLILYLTIFLANTWYFFFNKTNNFIFLGFNINLFYIVFILQMFNLLLVILKLLKNKQDNILLKSCFSQTSKLLTNLIDLSGITSIYYLVSDLLTFNICYFRDFNGLLRLNKEMDDCLIGMQLSACRIKEVSRRVILVDAGGGSHLISVPSNSNISVLEVDRIVTIVEDSYLSYKAKKEDYEKLCEIDREINKGKFEKDLENTFKTIKATYKSSLSRN